MRAPHYADVSVRVFHGDCLDVLRELPDASVDSVVTDPPYSIGFMGRTWDSHDSANEDASFAYWLSGFTDGEGCFRVQRHERGTFTCTFSIKVRRDERGTLERIRRFLGGIGTIRDGEGSGNANPQTMWAVQDKEGCKRLVQHFDKYPLQAKKRLDYEPWAQAVLEWHNMKRGNRWHGSSDWSRMAELKARVEGARQYVDPAWSGNGFQDWTRLWAAECLRVLKPGGHLLAFGAPRQWHRLAAGIEDAGFEIRDSVAWLTGSGFPKSLDVSKAIDKAAGAEREVVGVSPFASRKPRGTWTGEVYGDEPGHAAGPSVTAPATPDAERWQGWGTALKPAFEPVVVARKPLAGTVASNVLTHGTGALNIDACRTNSQSSGPGTTPKSSVDGRRNSMAGAMDRTEYDGSKGRWPANVVLDESQAAELDQQSGTVGANPVGKNPSQYPVNNAVYSAMADRAPFDYGDQGGASRFFYVAKADASERPRVDGVAHPTVKPLALMRWLVRLVTPPGGTVLEPFAGSGTTVEACIVEGFQCVAIEREADYLPLIEARIARRRDPVRAIELAKEDAGLFALLDEEPA